LARQVIFMQKGEILANQDIDQFFHAPACSDAAEYLAYERI